MPEMTAQVPHDRQLRWPDGVLSLQERITDLKLNEPLYIVGGAVRDAFLHRQVKDLDLATPTNAITIARNITNALDGDIFIMDAERGVARVLIDLDDQRFTIDVANYRGDDLLADLQGRDFTTNAMAVDLHGDLNALIDPLNGAKATRHKVIQRCTPQSIADDPIRGLRAVRQSVQLGFRILPDIKADIRAHAPDLMDTSAERVRDEFFNLLALSRPVMALRVAHSLGLLSMIIPEVTAMHDVALPSPHHFDLWKHALRTIEHLSRIVEAISYRRNDNTVASFSTGILAMQFDRYRTDLNTYLDETWPNERAHRTLLLLAALLSRVDHAQDITLSAEQVLQERAIALRLSSIEIKHLTNMVRYFKDVATLNYDDNLTLHRFWYPQNEMGIDTLLLALADYLATYGLQVDQDAWLIQVERAITLLDAFFGRYNQIVSPDPVIDGHDLMRELALQGGPIVGELLAQIREGQVSGTIKTYDDALEQARRYLDDRN